MKIIKIAIVIIVILFIIPRLCTRIFIGTTGNAELWRFEQYEDKMYDNKYLIASIDGANQNATLTIRCNESIKKLNFFIVFRKYLNSHEEIQVTYRFDDNYPSHEQWMPSAEGDAVFSPNGNARALDVLSFNRLIVEVQDFNNVRHLEEFDLHGDKTELKKVLRACGISQ